MNAECPACGATYLRDKHWKKLCLPCWVKSKKADGFTLTPPAPAPTAPQIEPEMLRRLLQLAHPDRHNGSEAAHKATLYLLALKEGRAP